MNNELLLKTFRNTLGAAVYIFAVSQVMRSGETLFGNEDSVFMPFVFLLLFSLSAAVVGGLVFGLSVVQFFEGRKAESIRSAIYSVGWLGLYTVLGLLVLMIVR
ncbi:MAG: hypothetical protein PHG63_00875 [Candidatus Dojkabacteria bacterium]|nr:hypothetical protein [Candidatus Dojkabacteria bacterium]